MHITPDLEANRWTQPSAQRRRPLPSTEVLPLPKGEGERFTEPSRTLRGGLSGMESLRFSNIFFPLTPALSLRERVKDREWDDDWSRSDIRVRSEVLPLPSAG